MKANPDWLTGYSYRRSHVIVHATGADINYQKRIIVKNGTSEGASTTFETNDTITVNNKIRSDFGDVNWTSSDGSTCLKYWMEILNTGKNATFWVKIAANLTSVDQTVYMYYGKSGQTTSSSIGTTGIFGDDIDDGSISDWTVVSAAVNSTIKRSGGYSIKLYLSTGYATAKSPAFTGQTLKCSLIYYIYATSTTANDRVGGPGSGAADYFWSSMGHAATLWYYYNTAWVSTGKTFSASKWYKVELILDIDADSCINYLVNDTSLATSKAFKNTLASLTQCYFYDYQTIMFIDDVFLRKYVSPEPSHGSWGSEETSGQTKNFYGTLSPSFSITNAKTWLFNRQGLITETFTLTSTPQFLLKLFGTIIQQFMTIMQKTMTFNRYALLNPTFSMTDTKTIIFNRYVLLNPSFSITSNFITARTLNFYGLINEAFNILSQKTFTFNIYSTINPSFTITSITTFVSAQILNLYGIITQAFTITFQKAFSLNRYGALSLTFTIETLTQGLGTFLNLFGTIPFHFNLLTIINLTQPPIDLALVLACFAVVMAIVAIGLVATKKD